MVTKIFAVIAAICLVASVVPDAASVEVRTPPKGHHAARAHLPSKASHWATLTCPEPLR